jgi:uncharacterized protein (DUF302 family)
MLDYNVKNILGVVLMKTVFSFLAGLVVAGVLGWFMMPGLMLKEYQSPLDTNQTIKTITKNAKALGWVVPSVSKLHKSIKKHGGFDLTPVYLVNLCNASHAFRILEDDKNKVIATMMPCTISVYEKADGKTYIGTMNAELLGKMFGGNIAQIFGVEVAQDQEKFIKFAK